MGTNFSSDFLATLINSVINIILKTIENATVFAKI